MEDPNLITQYPHTMRIVNDSRLIACSFWLRAGFVGTSIFVAGLLMLATGDSNPLFALASAAAGGTLGVYAWQRGWTLLERADRDHTPFPAAELAAVRNHALDRAAMPGGRVLANH